MAIIRPSNDFEGSRTPGRNPNAGIYRAVFIDTYLSPTKRGDAGFKMKWELVSDPRNSFEITNAYSSRSNGLFYKLMNSWIPDWRLKTQFWIDSRFPNLTPWLEREADVVVDYLGKVPCIKRAHPPETLLAKVGEFNYTRI
jgi:hypothetical protein